MARKSLLLISLFILLSTLALGYQLPGSGTSSDPYEISNLTDLNETRENMTAVYELVSDINASDTENWNSGSGFDPIGVWGTPFEGDLYGNGHTITGFYSSIPSGSYYVGMFGVINNSKVKNLEFEDAEIQADVWGAGVLTGTMLGENIQIKNVNVSGTVNNTAGGNGLLVGTNNGEHTLIASSHTSGEVKGGGTYNGGLIGGSWYETNVTIRDSSSTANVTGTDIVGGIAGSHLGVIKDSHAAGKITATGDGQYGTAGGLVGSGYEVIDSYATGNVTGLTRAGGLVGSYEGDTGDWIQDSYATGSVNGTSNVGGLVGYSASGSGIKNSYATGDVFGSGENIGGLTGRNTVKVKKSFAIGDVSGNTTVGGLVGKNYDDSSKIMRSFATGDVNGSENVGGLVGGNGYKSGDNFGGGGSINYSYAVGEVTGDKNAGGLVGKNKYVDGSGENYIGDVNESYWDTQATNQSNAVGLGSSGVGPNTTGLTTSEMTGSSASSNMVVFDFVNDWEVVSGVNNDYPVLQLFGHTDTGNPPTIENVSPSGINMDPTEVELEIEIVDPEDNRMDISFYDGTGSEIENVDNVGNGVYEVSWNGLNPDKSYSWSAEVSDGVNAVISQPNQVSTGTNSFTTIDIDLSWTDNSTNEKGFRIFSNSSGSFSRSGNAPRNSQSFTSFDSGLEFGERVCYRVRAFNQYGDSPSAEACITP